MNEGADIRAAWLDQGRESIPVQIERLQARRIGRMFETSRSELMSSMAAVLLFTGVIAWRFGQERREAVWLGCCAALMWVAATVFRYRRSIWRREPAPDSIVKNGLEHYVSELALRRDHLRSVWIWNGPLLLACGVSAAMLFRHAMADRLWKLLPLVLLLFVWGLIGLRQRLRLAAELQREIDEIQESVQ